jgi:hypothetical protein
LIEYAVILFRKQKVSKYGIPSQSVYSDKASAAAAIAAATSSATAGAFALASGLAQLGGNTGLKTNNRLSPRPTSTSQQPNDEMYDITSPMVPNMYEDSSSK